MHIRLILDNDVLTYGLTVPEALRPMLTEAVAEDLGALEPSLSSALDAPDVTAWHRSSRALLDGLLAGHREVCFPAEGSELHGLAANCARDAISSGNRDDALLWTAIWSELPERPA
ncbi:MAG: hypothetical protein QOE25_1567 [Actinomycetota bacterium]|jgi:hypothetical protein|nr:hypothetical protein [Actinomycetota bacterium]